MVDRSALLGTVSAVVLSAPFPVLAQAQPAAPSRVLQGVEEIVITAERRAESQQSVPVAVTTLSEGMLERQQITSIAALDRIVPNIVMNPNTGTSSASKIFLRGVGEDESFFTADTPVGIYVDDVYIARQTGAMFDLFDIARLEVLRGPQGTLYGRNTSAGAVKLVTRKPTPEAVQFQGDLTLGTYGRFDARASANMPIGTNAALQVAGLIKTRDGYTNNAFNDEDVNDQNVKGLRASLLLTPMDRLNVLVTGDIIRERSTPGYPVPLVLNATRDPIPVPATGDFYETFADIDEPDNDLDQNGVSATIEYLASDSLTLKSVTAYRNMSNYLFLDADGTAAPPANPPPPLYRAKFHLFQDQDQWQFSQEFQATGNAMDGRLNYVAGVYVFREFNDQATQSVLGLPALNLFFTRANTVTALETLGTTSYAGYGSATYDLTDRLALTAGLRWTSETKRYTNYVITPAGTQQVVCLNTTRTGNFPGSAGACTPAQTAAGGLTFLNGSGFEETWTDWTPRLVVDYRWTDDILTYASAAKGFKGGTTSGRTTAGADNFNRLIGEPETNWSYEVGIKADWLQKKLRTNVAAFWNEYEGLQYGVTSPSGGFGRINAGDATIKGLEVEAVAVPVEGLEFFGSLGLLEGEYDSFTASLNTCTAQGITTLEGLLALDLKQTPDWSVRVGFDYSMDLGNRGVVSFGADYSVKAKHYNNLCNSEGIAVRDYEFVNAQVRWESGNGNWAVTLAGTNLTDNEVFNGGFDFGRSLGFASAYLYPPRMYTVNLRYRY